MGVNVPVDKDRHDRMEKALNGFTDSAMQYFEKYEDAQNPSEPFLEFLTAIQTLQDKIDACKPPNTSFEPLAQEIDQLIEKLKAQYESLLPTTNNLLSSDELSDIENAIKDKTQYKTAHENKENFEEYADFTVFKNALDDLKASLENYQKIKTDSRAKHVRDMKNKLQVAYELTEVTEEVERMTSTLLDKINGYKTQSPVNAKQFNQHAKNLENLSERYNALTHEISEGNNYSTIKTQLSTLKNDLQNELNDVDSTHNLIIETTKELEAQEKKENEKRKATAERKLKLDKEKADFKNKSQPIESQYRKLRDENLPLFEDSTKEFHEYAMRDLVQLSAMSGFIDEKLKNSSIEGRLKELIRIENKMLDAEIKFKLPDAKKEYNEFCAKQSSKDAAIIKTISQRTVIRPDEEKNLQYAQEIEMLGYFIRAQEIASNNILKANLATRISPTLGESARKKSTDMIIAAKKRIVWLSEIIANPKSTTNETPLSDELKSYLDPSPKKPSERTQVSQYYFYEALLTLMSDDSARLGPYIGFIKQLPALGLERLHQIEASADSLRELVPDFFKEMKPNVLDIPVGDKPDEIENRNEYIEKLRRDIKIIQIPLSDVGLTDTSVSLTQKFQQAVTTIKSKFSASTRARLILDAHNKKIAEELENASLTRKNDLRDNGVRLTLQNDDPICKLLQEWKKPGHIDVALSYEANILYENTERYVVINTAMQKRKEELAQKIQRVHDIDIEIQKLITANSPSIAPKTHEALNKLVNEAIELSASLNISGGAKKELNLPAKDQIRADNVSDFIRSPFVFSKNLPNINMMVSAAAKIPAAQQMTDLMDRSQKVELANELIANAYYILEQAKSLGKNKNTHFLSLTSELATLQKKYLSQESLATNDTSINSLIADVNNRLNPAARNLFKILEESEPDAHLDEIKLHAAQEIRRWKVFTNIQERAIYENLLTHYPNALALTRQVINYANEYIFKLEDVKKHPHLYQSFPKPAIALRDYLSRISPKNLVVRTTMNDTQASDDTTVISQAAYFVESIQLDVEHDYHSLKSSDHFRSMLDFLQAPHAKDINPLKDHFKACIETEKNSPVLSRQAILTDTQLTTEHIRGFINDCDVALKSLLPFNERTYKLRVILANHSRRYYIYDGILKQRSAAENFLKGENAEDPTLKEIPGKTLLQNFRAYKALIDKKDWKTLSPLINQSITDLIVDTKLLLAKAERLLSNSQLPVDLKFEIQQLKNSIVKDNPTEKLKEEMKFPTGYLFNQAKSGNEYHVHEILRPIQNLHYKLDDAQKSLDFHHLPIDESSNEKVLPTKPKSNPSIFDNISFNSFGLPSFINRQQKESKNEKEMKDPNAPVVQPQQPSKGIALSDKMKNLIGGTNTKHWSIFASSNRSPHAPNPDHLMEVPYEIYKNAQARTQDPTHSIMAEIDPDKKIGQALIIDNVESTELRTAAKDALYTALSLGVGEPLTIGNSDQFFMLEIYKVMLVNGITSTQPKQGSVEAQALLAAGKALGDRYDLNTFQLKPGQKKNTTDNLYQLKPLQGKPVDNVTLVIEHHDRSKKNATHKPTR